MAFSRNLGILLVATFFIFGGFHKCMETSTYSMGIYERHTKLNDYYKKSVGVDLPIGHTTVAAFGKEIVIGLAVLQFVIGFCIVLRWRLGGFLGAIYILTTSVLLHNPLLFDGPITDYHLRNCVLNFGMLAGVLMILSGVNQPTKR